MVGELPFSQHQCLTEDGFIEGGEGCGPVDHGPARVQAGCGYVESDAALQEYVILDMPECIDIPLEMQKPVDQR